jgi:hypothetical protein
MIKKPRGRPRKIPKTNSEINQRKMATKEEIEVIISEMFNKFKQEIRDEFKLSLESQSKDIYDKIDSFQTQVETNFQNIGQVSEERYVELSENGSAVEQRLIEIDQREEGNSSEYSAQIANINNKVEALVQKVDKIETSETTRVADNTATSEGTSLPSCLANESLPKFNGKSGSIPKEFISLLKDYFVDHKVGEEHQLRVAYKCLESGARIWGAANKANIKTFADFEAKLMQEYWNSSRKREYRQTVLGKPYNIEGSVSMTEFLANKMCSAKYIEPEMTEKEIIEEIRNLFPLHIKNALISGRADNYQSASELLQMLDLNENKEKVPQKPYQGHKYNESSGNADGGNRGQGNYHFNNRGRSYQRGGNVNYAPRGRGINLLRVNGGRAQVERGGYTPRYRGNYRQQPYYNQPGYDTNNAAQNSNETQPKTQYGEQATPSTSQQPSGYIENNPFVPGNDLEPSAPPQPEN